MKKKNLKSVIALMVVSTMLVGCSCGGNNKDNDNNLPTSASTQELTTKNEVNTEQKAETETTASQGTSENATDAKVDVADKTETTKQVTTEQQTTKQQTTKQETTKQETTKKQQETTTKKQQQETTTKKQQETTTKKQQETTTKKQETTTSNSGTPAIKEPGVIYDTLTIHYIKGTYTIPDNYKDLLRHYEKMEGEQIDPDEEELMVEYSVGLYDSDAGIEESKWKDDTVKANVFGNELCISYGTNVDAVEILTRLYGEPLCSTDLDAGNFGIVVYKYKTNKQNNENEIFITFTLLRKELFGVGYLISTEEMVREAVEDMN